MALKKLGELKISYETHLSWGAWFKSIFHLTCEIFNSLCWSPLPVSGGMRWRQGLKQVPHPGYKSFRAKAEAVYMAPGTG